MWGLAGVDPRHHLRGVVDRGDGSAQLSTTGIDRPNSSRVTRQTLTTVSFGFHWQRRAMAPAAEVRGPTAMRTGQPACVSIASRMVW